MSVCNLNSHSMYGVDSDLEQRFGRNKREVILQKYVQHNMEEFFDHNFTIRWESLSATLFHTKKQKL